MSRENTMKARVLVVDDDGALLCGLKLALERDGYQVATVLRGDQVMAAIELARPDVMLLDIMMPGMDGWQVLKMIRACPETTEIPVILLTAKEAVEAKVLGLSLGADDYLTKPFSIHELRWRIIARLRRSMTSDDESISDALLIVGEGMGRDRVRLKDVVYLDGIHNYTKVHTYDECFLSRLGLGVIEERFGEKLVRVHRSYLVNPRHVKGGRWVTKSSYRLRMGDAEFTEIPVSRRITLEVQSKVGLR